MFGWCAEGLLRKLFSLEETHVVRGTKYKNRYVIPQREW